MTLFKVIRDLMFIEYFKLISEEDIIILGDYHFIYNNKRYIIRKIFDEMYQIDIDNFNYLRDTNHIKKSDDLITIKDEINSSNLFPKILDHNNSFIILEYFQEYDVLRFPEIVQNNLNKQLSEFLNIFKNSDKFETYLKYINTNDIFYVKSLNKIIFTDYEEIYYIDNKNDFIMYNYVLDITTKVKNEFNECRHLYITLNPGDQLMINDFKRYYKITNIKDLYANKKIYTKYFYN